MCQNVSFSLHSPIQTNKLDFDTWTPILSSLFLFLWLCLLFGFLTKQKGSFSTFPAPKKETEPIFSP